MNMIVMNLIVIQLTEEDDGVVTAEVHLFGEAEVN